MVKQLIVNGDDFGRSREVNAGVIRAHRDGILNSASLMIGEHARDEAIAYARANPSLDLGLHLVVCMGTAVSPPASLTRLVDSQGRFSNKPIATGMKYFFDGRITEKLRAECRAQIEEHLKLAGPLSHVDGHLNFHVHPAVSDILLDLAVEYGVPFLRVPDEPLGTALRLARDHLGRKIGEAAVFGLLSWRARRRMQRRGIRSSDRLFGLYQTAHFTEAYLLALIPQLQDGVTELYLHPALDVGESPPDAACQLETQLLVSPSLAAALRANNVHLTTYRDLAAARS
jgi:hopanoid biosynthesis associated protein HpnK